MSDPTPTPDTAALTDDTDDYRDQDADLNPDIPVWTVGALGFQSEAGRVSVVWGVDGLGADGRMIRPDLAEKTAHALLAAAREARRLAEETQQ